MARLPPIPWIGKVPRSCIPAISRSTRCSCAWEHCLGLTEIAHHFNHEAKEWFAKYMQYKRHEQATRKLGSRACCWGFSLSQFRSLQPCPTQNHLPMGYQRCGRAIEADKERKKQLAKEGALASRAHGSLKIDKTHWLVDWLNLLVAWRFELIGLEDLNLTSLKID